MSKICTKCGIEKDITDFYKKGNRYRSECKECTRIDRKKVYYEKGGKERDAQYKKENKDKINEFAREWRRKNPEKVMKYREKSREFLDTVKTPCIKCGENKPWLIQFHHVDPNTKSFNICHYAASGASKELILEEIKKCVCLCSSCHDEFHHFFGKTLENGEESLKRYLEGDYNT